MTQGVATGLVLGHPFGVSDGVSHCSSLETAWLTQANMAALFQTTNSNVNMHLRNIFSERELQPHSVIQEFLITAADGKQYRTNREPRISDARPAAAACCRTRGHGYLTDT